MTSQDFYHSPIPTRKYYDSHEDYEQSMGTLRKQQNKNERVLTYEHQEGTQKYLKNFLLGENIGLGTFSKVRIAKHILTNEKVALKIIEKKKIATQADQTRLNRQIKIMRKVRHPNIIQLYQIIQTKKYIYLITQYAARGELFQHIISHQKLSQIEAARFLLQLIDAIQYLHKLGVAHRDLKPENLLLDHKHNIKVVDFGLSNIYSHDSKLSTACGSPCYACPQMINSQPYEGLKADIWSIGIVLYAMCFGYLPFEHQNTKILYQMIRQGKYQIPQFASQNLRDMLSGLLKVSQQQRYSLQDIRNHPFCNFCYGYRSSPVSGIIFTLSELPYEEQIQQEMNKQYNIETNDLKKCITTNKHNQLTCTYYLVLQRKLRQKNQCWNHYFIRRASCINRYQIIQKVKASYDKRLMMKRQKRNYEQNYTEHKNGGRQIERICKTIEKYQKIKKYKQKSGKKQKKLVRQQQIVNFDKRLEKKKPKINNSNKKQNKSKQKRTKSKSAQKVTRLIF